MDVGIACKPSLDLRISFNWLTSEPTTTLGLPKTGLQDAGPVIEVLSQRKRIDSEALADREASGRVYAEFGQRDSS